MVGPALGADPSVRVTDSHTASNYFTRDVACHRMPAYRTVPDADDDAFRALVQYAFRPQEGPYDPEEAPEAPDLGERRGYYDADDLLACCLHYDLTLAARDDAVAAGGVSLVACAPEHRRRGHVRDMLAESVAEYRDLGRHLAVLWPFDVGFYRRLGWATVAKLATWEVDPGDLDGVVDRLDDPDAGRFERLDPADWTELPPVLAADHYTHDLAMRRSEGWWRDRVFDRWDAEPFVYGWRDHDGALRSYLVYAVDEEDDGRTLEVWDHAAADREARRHLFRFLRDHDSQVDGVRYYTPADAVAGADFDLHRELADPKAVEPTVNAGGMARLVDVAADLPVLAGDAARDPTVDCDVVVEDSLAPWNDGRFRVQSTAGEALAVERVDDGAVDATSERPTARLDVGALTQVVVGARSVEAAEELGDVAGDEAALAELAACFPPRRVWLREGF